MPETLWVRAGATKLDRAVRHAVLAAYRGPRYGACWLRRPLLWLRERLWRIPVIVQMTPDCPQWERLALINGLRRRRSASVRELALVRGMAARVSLRELKELIDHPGVQRVYFDRPVRALLDVAAPSVGADRVWQQGGSGRGVTVAIVDTGIHPHEDFLQPEPRIVGFRDFVRGRSRAYDDNGHGTHVAGIVAGSGARSGGRYRGIAPEANLVAVKVLDRFGFGSMSTVIAGIQWVVEQRARLGIRVLSLSLGAAATGGYEDDPVAQAAGAAWQAGIVVCAAAGNDGPEAGTIASPGIHPSVITVGATDDRGSPDRGDDGVASFSSRGPTPDGLMKPDLVAPGTEITAPQAPGSQLAKQLGSKNAPYATLSGTSMA
ncbi:MAG TPA: S8 family peptidase, partial [Bacillota bacterium]